MIRLAVFPMFNFTPYYDPSPPSWEEMANSMSSFWQFRHYQKGCIFRAGRSLLPDLTYPQWYNMLPLVHLLKGSYHGFTWFYHQRWGVKLVSLCLILRMPPPPPIIGGTCMCLSVVLFVNKWHYWLVWKGKDKGNCKTFLYCKRETTLSWICDLLC